MASSTQPESARQIRGTLGKTFRVSIFFMSFAEQLKAQLNIVDVVGQYVRLKRQGAGPRHVGLCPFHTEKTPSFYVLSNLGVYKCFGCEASGDVFQFVMDRESLTFPETLKHLAERYGIPMPTRQRLDDPEAQVRSAVLEMHVIAADLFQQNLRSSNGSKAREYLSSRGVSAASAEEFRVGLSDPSGQQLVARLQKFGPALLEESGLVSKRQEGTGFYDRFRNRLMFPIHNESGAVIGFGARALREGDEPKYLNSPETKIYKKSKVLYNLHRAKIDARKQDRMVLVEGYMDVIGVYSAGVKEVVASSGTALGNEQVRSIKRQISQQQANGGHIILNLDPDSAGVRSTEKHIGALLSEGLRVKVLVIPGGLDPDEYINQHGPDAYGCLLDNAESYFHWLADRMRQRFDLRTAEGRADTLKALTPVLQLVTDHIERGAIVSELAEYLNMDRDLIRDSLGRPSSQTKQPPKPRDIGSAIPPNEKLLVTCLLLSEDAREAVKQYLRLADVAHLLDMKSFFDALLALDREEIPFSLTTISARLDTRVQKILEELSFADIGISEEDAPQQAIHCLRALEATSIDSARRRLRTQIRDMEGAGNFTEALRLTTELDKLKRAAPGLQ